MNDTDASALLKILMRIDREDAEPLKDYGLQHARHTDAIFDMQRSMGRDIKEPPPRQARRHNGHLPGGGASDRTRGRHADGALLDRKTTNVVYAEALKKIDAETAIRDGV